jgi:AbrB family looped-hinge helix DNA binding protein
MRITSKGQVTIPQLIREQLGLLPETEVEFVVEGSSVRIVKKSQPGKRGRGQTVIARLRGSARPVSMTTDQIMALTRGDE